VERVDDRKKLMDNFEKKKPRLERLRTRGKI
jgi:hypothetical protein